MPVDEHAPRTVDVLAEAVAALPEADGLTDHADPAAYAALAALTEPSVAGAALGELATLERLALAQPHLVVDGSPVTETPDLDADGEPVYLDGIAQVTRAHTSAACPDCTRGLYSIDGVLVCEQLPQRVGTFDGKQGDIVACGRER